MKDDLKQKIKEKMAEKRRQNKNPEDKEDKFSPKPYV